MKRKILVTLLAFCLIASLCVVGAAASNAPAVLAPTASGNVFFANGTPITITEEMPESASLVKFDLEGEASGDDAYISWRNDEGKLFYASVGEGIFVFGGANGHITPVTVPSTSITMTGGKIKNLFGGNYGAEGKTAGTMSSVTGDVKISISGGAIVDNMLYGGGYWNTCVEGNVYLDFKGVDLSADKTNKLYVNGGVYGTGAEGTRDIDNGKMDTYAVANNVVITAENSKFYVLGAGGSGSTKVGSGSVKLTGCEVDILFLSGINGEVEKSSITMNGCEIKDFAATNRGFVGIGSVEINNSTVDNLNTGASEGCFASDSGSRDGSGVTGSVTYDIDADSTITNAVLTPTVKSDSGNYEASFINVSISKDGEPLNLSVNGFQPNDSKTVTDFTVPEGSTLKLDNVNAEIAENQRVTNAGTIDVATSTLTVPDGATLANAGDIIGEVTGSVTEYAVRVGSKGYTNLSTAMAALQDGDTITLLKDVEVDGTGKQNNEGVVTINKKNITLDGNGKELSVSGTLLDADDRGPSAINIQGNATVTVKDITINAAGAKHGLNIYDASKVTLEDVEITNAAWYAVVCNSSELEVNGLHTHGNQWGINVDTAASSASKVVINDATIEENDSIVFENGKDSTTETTINGGSFKTIKEQGDNTESIAVTVTDGTFAESVTDIATTPDYELSSNGSFTYYDSLSAAQAAAKPGDTITFVGGGAVETHTVTVIYDGSTTYTYELADGTSFPLPVLEKSGYTFTGWRVNSSNTIVRGGESYPITANTTFTAVWNMIMIPDTYDIAVDQPAHGTVDVSLSNASQGSVITVTATPDEGYELVYITVDGEPISGNSFVMPDHAVEVSAVFAEIGKEVNFVDVSRADWFYDYVQYVAQNGLMEGTTRTAFEPNASMTRAMFWTVLARIDGETITGDAWKTLAQTWAVESGISDGTNADALITREQMVTMLYRYAGSPVTGGMAISEFTDGSSVSDYAADAVTWALSEGILTGMGDGILAPQGTATRAQAAAMLMRFVEA